MFVSEQLFLVVQYLHKINIFEQSADIMCHKTLFSNVIFFIFSCDGEMFCHIYITALCIIFIPVEVRPHGSCSSPNYCHAVYT